MPASILLEMECLHVHIVKVAESGEAGKHMLSVGL